MKSAIVSTALLAAASSADAYTATPTPTRPVTGQVSNLIPGEVNSQQAFAESSFPIAPENLIARAKEVLSPQIEVGTKDGGECLADDFEFVAAVVGPLPKEEYLGALGSFKLTDAFSIQQNYFGFTVDPVQTNRVWFFTRQVAEHVAPFMGADPKDTMNDGVLNLPPQITHMDFNSDGLVKEFGFYTADRRQGNTGGE